MAIKLNGVALSGSLQWTDRLAYSSVAQEVLVTLGGNPVIYAKGLQGNRPITLVATEDTGWITRAMMEHVVGLASIPGGVYTLEIHGESFNVVFAHHEPPAVDLVPLQPRAVPVPEDYFTGTLKFITV
jgi:hypothetical protein